MKNYITHEQKIAGEKGRREKYVRLRMYIVFSICIIGFIVVLSRAVHLHMAENVRLNRIADKQYHARIPLSLRRGKLFDRNGSELAVSLPVPSLYADPSQVGDVFEAAKKLSPLLNVPEKDIADKLRSRKRFVWIKRRMSYDMLKKIMSLNVPGIHYVEESKRFYPNGVLASQILGAVGYDSQALAGIEMVYSDVLVSKKKTTSIKRDARGKLYSTPLGFDDQSDVGQVYLTIDKQIQFITENALRKAVQKFHAVDGVAVVMDPSNGDVLAMASSPNFDPNRYSKYPVDSWRNRPVTDSFEPGSTFKVFVVAAALNDNVVNAESVYNCGNGSIRIGKDVLRDHHPYGDLSVQDIIKFSSNIGSLKIAFDLGREKLFKTLKKFGIGFETGIDFPGEIGGVLRDYEGWHPVEHATIAFGQGLTTTPLQMAAAFSAVINGGIYYKPRLVGRVIDRDGDVTTFKPQEVYRPIRGDVSKTIRYMLARVVQDGGTGVRVRSNAYSIGGKTGTAQKVGKNGKGYAKGRYFSSFIGFSPVEKPALVVFIGINEPKGAYYGGTVAAPAVKEIIERSLNYIGVPSSRSPVLYTENVKSHRFDQVKTGVVKKVEFQKVGHDRYSMPDLTGLTMRDILTAAGELMIETDSEGTGVAVKQNPKPGSVIGKGSKFSVRFELPR